MTDTANDLSELERRLRRLEAALEVQNLLGRFQLFYSAYRQDLILPLFSTADDTRIVTPRGVYVGADAAQRAFGGSLREDAPLRDLTGEYVEHLLTTPVVEVSAEGDRVRATWVSPGAEAHHFGPDRTLTALWMWGRYAVESVCEGESWKIRGFEFSATFASDYHTSFVDAALLEPPPLVGPDAPDEAGRPPAYGPGWDPRSLPLGPEPFSQDGR